MNDLALNHPANPQETVLKLIDLLKHSGDLRIDARVVEPGACGDGRDVPEISIEITGPDAPLFLDNEAELLKAVHHIAGSALGFEQHDLDRLWFDIGNIKADRMAELRVPRRPRRRPRPRYQRTVRLRAHARLRAPHAAPRSRRFRPRVC